jgi:hypothetical protein
MEYNFFLQVRLLGGARNSPPYDVCLEKPEFKQSNDLMYDERWTD